MKKLIFGLFVFNYLSVSFAGESLQNDQNQKKIFDLTMKAASANDIQDQYKICNLYYDGEGVEKSYELAFQWCHKAASQNHAEAQTFVALMYSSGEGVKEDKQKAIEWFRQAASRGNGTAQYSLGNRYAAYKQYDISYALLSLAMENGEWRKGYCWRC